MLIEPQSVSLVLKKKRPRLTELGAYAKTLPKARWRTATLKLQRARCDPFKPLLLRAHQRPRLVILQRRCLRRYDEQMFQLGLRPVSERTSRFEPQQELAKPTTVTPDLFRQVKAQPVKPHEPFTCGMDRPLERKRLLMAQVWRTLELLHNVTIERLSVEVEHPLDRVRKQMIKPVCKELAELRPYLKKTQVHLELRQRTPIILTRQIM